MRTRTDQGTVLDFLQWWIGAIVWLVANVVYVDMKRKGLHGFTRFAAFWAGTPTTWISLFAVQDGQQPRFERPDDDDTTLLDEIRRDRVLRGESVADGEAVLGGAALPGADHESDRGAEED